MRLYDGGSDGEHVGFPIPDCVPGLGGSDLVRPLWLRLWLFLDGSRSVRRDGPREEAERKQGDRLRWKAERDARARVLEESKEGW